MSPAPQPPGRSPPPWPDTPIRIPPRPVILPPTLAPPGRSSSPLRDCGRSTWTHSRTRRDNQLLRGRSSYPLPAAPVFI